jgi:hypothetical protein
VVLEDPVSAAFFPHSWQQLQKAWQQQQQLLTQPAHAAVAESLEQPYQASRQWEPFIAAAGPSAAAAPAAAAGGGGGLTSLLDTGWHELQKVKSTISSSSIKEGLSALGARWVPGLHQQQGQQQQQHGIATVAATVAALEFEAADAAVAAATAAGPSAILAASPATGWQQQQQPPQQQQQRAGSLQAAGQSPAGSVDDFIQLSSAAAPAASLLGHLSSSEPPATDLDGDVHGRSPGSASSSSSSSSGRRKLSSSRMSVQQHEQAAEQDLSSGLASSSSVPAAPSAQAAADAVAADVTQLTSAAAAGSGAGRAQLVSHMLHRLQELPWRRIDVSFLGARFGFAHNNIQASALWIDSSVSDMLAQDVVVDDGWVVVVVVDDGWVRQRPVWWQHLMSGVQVRQQLLASSCWHSSVWQQMMPCCANLGTAAAVLHNFSCLPIAALLEKWQPLAEGVPRH